MTLKSIIYNKYEYDYIICFECDTDFSKYEYSPSLTLFKIGSFREHEKEVVIKITNIIAPEKERHKYIYGFNNEREGLTFIENYIKECKGVLK